MEKNKKKQKRIKRKMPATLLYPSEALLNVMVALRMPHPSEESDAEKDPKLTCLPIKFSDNGPELWTYDDKVSFMKIRLYLHHYLYQNRMIDLKRMVKVNDVLRMLDDGMEDRISYKDLIRVVSGHLYEY
jgi:hypothetical protein